MNTGKVRALRVNGPVRSELLARAFHHDRLGINMKDKSTAYSFFAPKYAESNHRQGQPDLQAVIDAPEMFATRFGAWLPLIGGSPGAGHHLKTEIAKMRGGSPRKARSAHRAEEIVALRRRSGRERSRGAENA